MPPVTGVDSTGSSGLPSPTPTFGVWGDSLNGGGVVGTSSNSVGVFGRSSNGPGVQGLSQQDGVLGTSTNAFSAAVHAINIAVEVAGGISAGLLAESEGYAVAGHGGNIGVYAYNTNVPGNAAYMGAPGFAGDFYGRVHVHGALLKSGGGFLIDHPLDPANKYLQHSFVESPDRKNIYDGVVTLNDAGEAAVELPSWFTSLNVEFRYQLTCIGKHAPVFVAQEIKNGWFRIAGGSSGIKVSWQVTGIRNDVWAKANPLVPEDFKPENERGAFLHPGLHGTPEGKGVQEARYPASAGDNRAKSVKKS